MPNPPIKNIDFQVQPGSAVVYTADGKTKYTFPIQGQTAGTPPTVVVVDNSDAITALGAKLDKAVSDLTATVAKAVSASSQGSSGSTSSSPPVVVAGLDFSALKPNAGDTISLSRGTYTGSLDVSVPCTFIGAGMRDTILDGQYGVGAGHRLAWGKGISHARADVTFKGIGFKRGGRGDNYTDMESGLYVEQSDPNVPVNVRASYCAFDDCEDGVAAPIGAKGVFALDHCVFGRKGENGLSDGLSHDTYVNIDTFTIEDSVFVGNSEANTIKARSRVLIVRRNFIGRGGNSDPNKGGRWIDAPGGTEITSEGNTYVTIPGTNTNQAFGLWDEGFDEANPGKAGFFHSKDDTFIFSRWEEVFWINNAGCEVTFENPTVKWIGTPGAKPPIVTIKGPGGITGTNPFVFNESNRIDHAPVAPDDPVMPA